MSALTFAQEAGTEKWHFDTDDFIFGAPVIADDGTIYVGSSDGTLYAIHSNSPGLANSSWPRFHHDNKGTGNMQTPTAIRQIDAALPQSFTVSQAYPNLFNPTTRIRINLGKNSHLRVAVYSAAGQLVASLLNAQKNAGNYELNWNANSFSSGLYIFKVTAHGSSLFRNALLIK